MKLYLCLKIFTRSDEKGMVLAAFKFKIRQFHFTFPYMEKTNVAKRTIRDDAGPAALGLYLEVPVSEDLRIRCTKYGRHFAPLSIIFKSTT